MARRFWNVLLPVYLLVWVIFAAIRGDWLAFALVGVLPVVIVMLGFLRNHRRGDFR
jgi:hypothetical protein